MSKHKSPSSAKHSAKADGNDASSFMDVSADADIQLSYKSRAGPWIAHFPTGTPSKDTMGQGGSEALQLSIYAQAEKKKGASHAPHLLVGENKSVIYQGDSSETSSTAKYLVGVFNRKKHTLSLYDSELFALKPTVKRIRSDANRDKTNDLEGLTVGQRYTAAKSDLVDSFGGRKKKQELLANIRNKIDDAALVPLAGTIRTELDTSAHDDMNLEEVLEAADEFRPIPPYNKDAEDPDDVYSIFEIITPEEIEALKEPANVFLKATKEEIRNLRSQKHYRPYVLDFLPRLSTVSKERKKQARILMYINYMLLFQRVSARDLNSTEVAVPPSLESVPPAVVKKFKSEFAETRLSENGVPEYSISHKMKDKLLLYMFVLCLMLENYRFAYEDLASILQLKPEKTAEYFRSLGCKIQTETDEFSATKVTRKVAVLTVPLQFPRPRRGRAKN